MRLVLDASVAVKLYAPEADTDLALTWLEGDGDFSAPDIFLVEVAQALLRHQRDGRLTKAELDSAVRELRSRVDIPFNSGQLIDRALSFAHALHHRLHDCMYLAAAERLACAVLTADERLARKVRASTLGIDVLLLTDLKP